MCDMPMDKGDVTCVRCWWRGKRHPYWRERMTDGGCPRCHYAVSDDWVYKPKGQNSVPFCSVNVSKEPQI
jgi:hypothetical protein